MKLITKIFTFLVGAIFTTSCGLDNYDSPQSTLNGTVTYQDKALGVRGTSDAVQLQLYQDGYEKHDPISVYVGQNGTFSAVLFNGQYKLVTKSGNGPWLSSDTAIVNVNGITSCTLEVIPYFTITNASFALNGSVAVCSAQVNQIVSSSSISEIYLLVSKTSFVDEGTYIARQNMEDPEIGDVTLSMDMGDNSDFASAQHLFARLGVKAAEADQAIYSDIVQLK